MLKLASNWKKKSQGPVQLEKEPMRVPQQRARIGALPSVGSSFWSILEWAERHALDVLDWQRIVYNRCWVVERNRMQSKKRRRTRTRRIFPWCRMMWDVIEMCNMVWRSIIKVKTCYNRREGTVKEEDRMAYMLGEVMLNLYPTADTSDSNTRWICIADVSPTQGWIHWTTRHWDGHMPSVIQL